MMRSALILPLLLGSSACGSSRATGTPQSHGSQLKLDTTPLRNNLLANRATFDGMPVTDLRQTGRCEAVIVTAQASTPVKWKDMDALITRTEEGRTTYKVASEGREHLLSVRETAAAESDTATRIGASLSVFDEACGGV